MNVDMFLCTQMPGNSSEEFTLKKYKEGLGKMYAHIKLFLCHVAEKEEAVPTPTARPITDWLDQDDNPQDQDLDDLEEDFDDLGGHMDDIGDIAGSIAGTSEQGQGYEANPFILQYAVTDFMYVPYLQIQLVFN